MLLDNEKKTRLEELLIPEKTVKKLKNFVMFDPEGEGYSRKNIATPSIETATPRSSLGLTRCLWMMA